MLFAPVRHYWLANNCQFWNSLRQRGLLTRQRPVLCGRWLQAIRIAVVMLSIVAFWGGPAAAITFDLDNTNDNENEEPSWDPGGHILATLMDAAADHWEFILPVFGPGLTYSIEFHWEADLDTNTLGLTTDYGPAIDKLLEFNRDRIWFDDPTPYDHSEFDFSTGQTFYSGLSSEQAAFFPGTTPPGALEVGFEGYALPDQVAGVSGNAPDGEDVDDLLSTIIHEMGHALGIIGEEPGEYNIYPHHVGWTFDVLVAEDDDSGHLGGDGLVPWLMCHGCANDNVRRLPSATDALVVAEDQGIEHVDLWRVGSISSGSWHDQYNWIGGRVPDQAQDVYIRHGIGTVSLQGDAQAKSLVIASGSSRVHTNNHRLSVPGGPTDVFTELIVDAGGQAELAELNLISTGRLTISGGTATVNGVLSINRSDGLVSRVQGRGNVRIGTLLLNNGLILADGGTLQFLRAGFPATILDLDGNSTEPGQVMAIDGDLIFDAVLTDHFDGVMLIGVNRTVTMKHDWALGTNGFLGLNGGSFLIENDAAILSDGNSSSTFGVHGQIQVPYGKRGHLQTKVRLENDATIDADGVLRLSGYTTFVGPSISGYAIEQYGHATVEDHSYIHAQVYDWDGDDTNPSEVTLAAFKRFNIFPDLTRSQELRIDYADNGYDGSTYVNGGHLEVRTTSLIDEQSMTYGPAPWTINPLGMVQLNNAIIATEGLTFDGSLLKGSPVVVAGTLQAVGPDNEVASDHFTLQPGGKIEILSTTVNNVVHSSGQLHINTAATYSGGTITGDEFSSIHHSQPVLVDGDVSVEVSTFDFDGRLTTLGNQINIQGGRLQVEAAAVQDGAYPHMVRSNFEISNGALMVSRVADPFAPGPPGVYLSWELKSNSEIELTGNATISASDDFNNLVKTGSEMQVAGLVKASGAGNIIYAPTRVLGGGMIVAHDDQLEIAAGTTIESGGLVKALVAGGIRFSQHLAVEAGGTLQADGRVLLEGSTYLQGGTFEGNAVISQDGDLFVEQPSTSNVKYLDLDGANDARDLRLGADFTVNAESIEYSWTNVNNPITPLDPVFNGAIDVYAPATLTMNIGDSAADAGWTLGNGVVYIDPNLDDGVGQGKGLTIAGSPLQFCNTFIHIGAGSWLNIDADASGIFTPPQGGGTMQFNADLSPGKSPAALSFEGSLAFGPDARVMMEIYRTLEAGGTDEPFDSFEVAGMLDLGGATLEVIFQDGFEPVAGQSFQLFSASSIVGSFSKVIPHGMPQGLMLHPSGLSQGFLLVGVAPEPSTFLLALFAVTLSSRGLSTRQRR